MQFSHFFGYLVALDFIPAILYNFYCKYSRIVRQFYIAGKLQYSVFYFSDGAAFPPPSRHPNFVA
jgi:hypothetical protein